MTLAVLIAMAVPSPATLRPLYLRTENLVEPRGLDETKPRFSWKLEAASPGLRNLKQTAYRLLVASEPGRLAEGKADIWDSGRIDSAETVHIEFGGKTLQSNAPYWWSVQVWDQEGNPSEWSRPASWSMGLLKPSDWKAKWIGFDRPLELRDVDPATKEARASFKGSKWIWWKGDGPNEAPKAERFFMREFTVPEGIVSASLLVTVDDQFRLSLDGVELAKSDGEKDAWRRPVTMDVTAKLKPGKHVIRIKAENTSSGISGVILKIAMVDRQGKVSYLRSDKEWKAATSADGPWEAAQERFNFGDGPWGWVGGGGLFLPPPRYLRKEFSVAKPVKRAMLYGSAFGLADFHLNGKKVGDEYFLPGWTDYEKRVYYRAYDVTKQIKRGGNAVGAILGDGWYAGYVGYGGRREHYGEKTRALAQLVIEYRDGTTDVIASGPDWRAGTGPILESDFLMGEAYDARAEMPGWDQAGFAKGDQWSPVDVGAVSKGKVEAFPGDPVRAYAILKAKTITQPKPEDAYVLDLGQNMAGFARIRVKGSKGQRITLRFAERLNPDGTIYTTNLRGARTIDTYTFANDGVATWEPRFTFHGFQYIEVAGLGRKPTPDEVVGVAITSDTPLAGTLETSDPMLNKLVSNARWTQQMNFIDIPTDCPQRDERLGWTGDAQAYIRTAVMTTDVQAFFTKWLVTLEDAQREDGQFPMVAPVKVAGSDGGPAWADAGVICPWTIYDAYADKRLLRRLYPSMKKFVEFCVKRSTPEMLPPAQFHCFGDWVSINANTPTDVIYTAYFAFSASLLARSADALGLHEEAKEHRALFRKVRDAFNKAYVSPEGVIKGDTQCAYVLAIAFDLLSPELTVIAGERLVADIEKRGGLSTGFVGTRDVMNALSKIGRNAVAYKLLHSTAFPSWGFTIKNGATSIWERWDGWTPEKGFQDPGMNSFAHYAFGAVVGWMYDQLPGIRNTSPGFATIRIAPEIDTQLKWVKSKYESIRGPIVSEWKIETGKLKMRVVVPPNVQAEIVVPGGEPRCLQGLKPKSAGPSSATFEVGSGEYTFEAILGVPV